jgi:hypothetical protein
MIDGQIYFSVFGAPIQSPCPRNSYDVLSYGTRIALQVVSCYLVLLLSSTNTRSSSRQKRDGNDQGQCLHPTVFFRTGLAAVHALYRSHPAIIRRLTLLVHYPTVRTSAVLSRAIVQVDTELNEVSYGSLSNYSTWHHFIV